MRTRIGDYEVDDFGAPGAVRYRATHVVLPRRAVIEVFDSGEARSKAIKLMRQACVLEALHHPGVPRVYECGLLDGRPWVAFERIEGVSLEEDTRSRKLETVEVIDMIDHVAAILADAHARGVLHRDIDPSVIYRCQSRGYPYALDGWSSACTLDTELASPVKGNPRYRAPELDDDRSADGRADVYALGVVAYEALVGDPPSARPPDTSGVLTSLVQLLTAMTMNDPIARPTAAEVRRAIRDLRDGHPFRAAEDADYDVECTFDEAYDQVDDVIELVPRAKPRWTPPLGYENRGLPARVVEIVPRNRHDPRRDD
jgi:serine/threonine protein kinase